MPDAMLTALPLTVLEGHVGILATTGAGKTYGAKTAVEDLLEAGRRVCVIDPTGVWWGLRAAPDGREGGYPVAILGGDHADVPLAPTSGAALARAVAQGAFSCIVDVVRMTVGERTRWFSDFAEELARSNRRPLHLVIDEAHLFAPQGRVNDPQSGRMVGAANHLVSGGRAMGLRIMLLSQRPAKLHKDSLTQVAALVPMWMMAPQDTAAVKAWIADAADAAAGREVLTSLPSLETGRGWLWAPRLGILDRIAFRALRTFDSSRAPAADEEAPTAELSALPFEELRMALAEADATAPNRAATPAVRQADLIAAETRGYERGRAEEQARWAAELRGRTLSMVAGLLADLGPERDGQQLPASKVSSPKVEPAAPKAPKPPAPQAARSGGAPGLGVSAKKLLAVLQAPNLPQRPLHWPDAAVLAVLTPSGGNFNSARSELIKADQVTYGPEGLRAVHSADAPALDAAAITQAWCDKLGGSPKRILGNLYVTQATKAELARELDLAPSGGSWNTAWKALRSNNLVEEDGGSWRLAKILQELKPTRARR